MKKNIIFIFFILIVSVRIPVWLSTELHELPVDSEGRQDTIRLAPTYLLPADVFPFQADTWQQKSGCMKTPMKYVGVSTHGTHSFAIVNSGGKGKIYVLGDAVENKKKESRIIWLDRERILLRQLNQVNVLCRERLIPSGNEQSVQISKVNEPSLQPVAKENEVEKSLIDNTQRPALYKSSLGTVAAVPDDHGEIAGYRLQNCYRYCWLLKQLSLQVDDVVTAIQGKAIINMTEENLKKLIMEHKTDVELTIERNGELHIITIPWKKIAPMARLLK
jgi:type II secretory pathway component PulC